MTQLGGTFDFKIVKLHAAYAIQDNIRLRARPSTTRVSSTRRAGAPYDNNAWMLGVSVPLFGGSILASYQYADADNITTRDLLVRAGLLGLGRRLHLPVLASYQHVHRLRQGGMGRQRQPVNNVSAGAAPSQRFDKQQFALGIRHLF